MNSPAGPPERRWFDQAATRAALLADPCRLHVLWLLCHRDHDVGALARHTDMSMAAVSHHLAKLRLAGLVIAQRRGRHQIYTVTDPQLGAVIDLLVAQSQDSETVTPRFPHVNQGSPTR